MEIFGAAVFDGEQPVMVFVSIADLLSRRAAAADLLDVLQSSWGHQVLDQFSNRGVRRLFGRRADACLVKRKSLQLAAALRGQSGQGCLLLV